jgi:glycosyltransferase involved in cell wall biosynthesis
VSSKNLLAQFEAALGPRESVYVVPLGVETPTPPTDRPWAREIFGYKPDMFVIGFVGRLDPCKDLGFLFEACAAAQLPPNARLLIVGDGPDRERLERLAIERGVNDRILWAGRLAEPHAAYAAMDLFVLPSVYEAFGNVVLEAMALGVPVIARRRSADPRRPVLVANEELIDHGQSGRLVDAHDPADLAAELRRLSTQPMLLRAMGRQARFRSRDRSWDAAAHAYMTILGREQRTLAMAA